MSDIPAVSGDRPNLVVRQDSRVSTGGSTAAATTTTISPPSVDARFSCNICFEPCQEPVVTQCGHLYCWPCLYRWIEPGMTPEDRDRLGIMTTSNLLFDPINAGRRECPVCKSPTPVTSLVPIYVRSGNDDDIVPSPVSKRSRQGHEEEAAAAAVAAAAVDASTVNGGTPDNADGNTNSTCATEQHASNDNRLTTSDAVELDDGDSLPLDHTDSSRNDENESEGDVDMQPETGLRQRLRFRSQDSVVSAGGHHQQQQQPVPNRPSASSPQRPSTRDSSTGHVVHYNNNNSSSNPFRPQNNGTTTNNRWITPMSPNGHGASLTHGIMLSFAQATHGAGNGAPQSSPQQHNSDVPPLHDPRGGPGGVGTVGGVVGGPGSIDITSETTQYLSRLLIMLTSFVILCLLLM